MTSRVLPHQSTWNPARLTLARELAGRTRNELAASIGKSVSAVSQFETGHIHPEPQTQGLLSMALGVPVKFFSYSGGAGPIPLESCHFRRLRSATQRKRRQLLAIGALTLDVYDLVDEFVDIPEPHVPQHDVASSAAIEAAADAVRSSWGLGLGPIPNTTALVESKGIIVSVMSTDNAAVDAFSFWHGVRPCIFLNHAKQSQSRFRFDIAHELGHLVLHADAVPGSPIQEREANLFASSFLLPRKTFGSECPTRLKWAEFWELKKRWRVSCAALIRRGYELELLTEASYRRGFLLLGKMGFRMGGEPYEPAEEEPQLLKKALDLLEREIHMPDVAGRLGLSDLIIRQLVPNLEQSLSV